MIEDIKMHSGILSNEKLLKNHINDQGCVTPFKCKANIKEGHITIREFLYQNRRRFAL